MLLLCFALCSNHAQINAPGVSEPIGVDSHKTDEEDILEHEPQAIFAEDLTQRTCTSDDASEISVSCATKVTPKVEVYDIETSFNREDDQPPYSLEHLLPKYFVEQAQSDILDGKVRFIVWSYEHEKDTSNSVETLLPALFRKDSGDMQTIPD